MTENTLPAITSPEPEQSSIWDRIDSVPALRAEIRRLEGEVRRANRRNNPAPLEVSLNSAISEPANPTGNT